MSTINLSPIGSAGSPLGSVVVLNPPQAIVTNGPSRIRALRDLADIDLTNLQNGSFLQYDTTINKWVVINSLSIGGTATALENIPTERIVGRISAGTGNSENLTPAQVVSMIISTEAENRLTIGADGKLFNPELNADPLAYYILAKA